MNKTLYEVTVRRATYQYQSVLVKASDRLSAREIAADLLEDDEAWDDVPETAVEVKALPIDKGGV